MKTVINEFREFAIKGSVLDMAVGILIGVAFNKMVQSLVNDIFMPPIGMVIGGVEFKDLKLTLRPATETTPGVDVRYGVFINTVVEFVIITFAAFVAVKTMNAIVRLREAETS